VGAEVGGAGEAGLSGDPLDAVVNGLYPSSSDAEINAF